MADNNNSSVANMPTKPNPALKQLDRLVGKWKAFGPTIDGTVEFEWMEGGFFMVQHVDFVQGGRPVKGVEYIGFDEDTQTLRSHWMDTLGSNFTYTYEFDGNTMTDWFGEKGSPVFLKTTFSDDGNSGKGRWQWPEGDGKIGGYEVTMNRIK